MQSVIINLNENLKADITKFVKKINETDQIQRNNLSKQSNLKSKSDLFKSDRFYRLIRL